ncbi:MAG: ABC transporter permease [Salinarimonas sp.]
MALFLVRRFLGMALTLLLVSLMVFLIMELPPGDYAERYVFRKFSGTGVAVTPSDIQAVRVEFGLDQPMMLRYWNWITGIVLRGDFGQAYSFLTSVNNVIGDKVWLTMGLLMATLVLTYLIAIPVGLYAAVRRGSGADYGLTIISYLGLALPNFLLALLLLYFANRWFGASIGGLLSEQYRDAPWSLAKLWDLVKHLWIPALVLGWSAIAYQLQTVRATMSDEIGKLSVMAARARGVPEARLLVKYPARLAINPVVSTIGFDVNRIFSELPIVAAVLGLTELGDLLLKSFLDLDMNVAGAILLLLTVVIVVMNFVSDLLLAWLDPRIRLEG